MLLSRYSATRRDGMVYEKQNFHQRFYVFKFVVKKPKQTNKRGCFLSFPNYLESVDRQVLQVIAV